MEKSANCLNCGHEITGNYCPNCGQKTTTHRYSFRHFITHDLIHGIWHVDQGILFTLKQLFTRPGHSIRAYVSGQRAGYFSFVTLLILILAMSHFFGEYAKITLSDLMPEASKQAMNQVEEFSTTYPKITLLLTIPVYSFFSYLWFRRSHLNMTEHFVLNAYKTAAELLIALIFTILTIFYAEVEVLKIIYGLVAFLTMGYSFIFYYQYFSVYGYSKFSLVLRSIAVVFSYLLFSTLIGSLMAVIKTF